MPMQLAAALTYQEDVLFACFDERLRAAAGEAGLNPWPQG